MNAGSTPVHKSPCLFLFFSSLSLSLSLTHTHFSGNHKSNNTQCRKIASNTTQTVRSHSQIAGTTARCIKMSEWLSERRKKGAVKPTANPLQILSNAKQKKNVFFRNKCLLATTHCTIQYIQHNIGIRVKEKWEGEREEENERRLIVFSYCGICIMNYELKIGTAIFPSLPFIMQFLLFRDILFLSLYFFGVSILEVMAASDWNSWANESLLSVQKKLKIIISVSNSSIHFNCN
jgi:hypothetical protein